MISIFPKKCHRPILLLVAISLLGGCLTEDDSCKNVVSTVGEPDMTATPAFAAATVAQNSTINVDIAVDDEAIEGTVFLLPIGSQDVTDAVSTAPFVTVATGSAETVTITLPILTPTLGTYYPAVVLCDSVFATCTTGAGYVEDISGIIAASGNYVRGTANGGTVDLSSLSDSCVTVSTIEVI